MEIALLTLRVVIGFTFVAHGAPKLFTALGGGGIRGTADAFAQIGLHPSKFHAWAAALSELGGGVLIAFGLVTPIAAAVAFALSGVGPGEWSLDNALDIDLAGTGWALGALGAGLLAGFGAVFSPRLASEFKTRQKQGVPQ